MPTVIDDKIAEVMDTPFDREELLWWLWISKVEWEMLYATSMVFAQNHRIPMMDSISCNMWDTAAILVREYDFMFDGIFFDENDRMWAVTDTPVEPKNILWKAMLGKGMVPDYDIHMRRAKVTLKNRIMEPDNLIEMINEAQLKAENDLAKVGRAIDAELTPDMKKDLLREAEELVN